MYETIAEMADRLNVSKRTIQIWANNGKIPGAVKQGKIWLIPRNSEVVSDEVAPAADKANIHLRTPMPLMNLSYVPGSCMDAINAMTDEESKAFALAEYYYATGDAEKACEQIELYSEMHGYGFKPAASVIYTFSHLSMGNVQFAKMGLGAIRDEIEKTKDHVPPQERAMQVFVETTASLGLNLPEPEERLQDYMYLLPKGMRIYACYVIACEMIKKKKCEKAVGTIELATFINKKDYPLALLYCHVICAVAYMDLKDVAQAVEHFEKAWELAYPDGLLEPIAEHHAVLGGLVERCVKPKYPGEYEKITALAKRYDSGKKRMSDRYSSMAEYDMPEPLTSMEMVVATLACREWSNAEIAQHIHLSTHTVKHYLSVVYQKIGISTRKELKEYMEYS